MQCINFLVKWSKRDLTPFLEEDQFQECLCVFVCVCVCGVCVCGVCVCVCV